MKKLLLAAVIAMTLATSACTESTEHGKCIGAFDDGDPNLMYKANGWNVAMGVIFVETIVVPIVVVMDDVRCPYAKRADFNTPKVSN